MDFSGVFIVRRILPSIFRYRIATLLLATSLVAIGLAGYKAYVEPFQVQREAALRLAATGATIQYRTADVPRLVKFFGEEHFQNVVAVDLSRRGFKTSDLEPLADLPCVERLYLEGTPLTDDGLRYVGRLPRLRRLALWRTRITDDGLAHLVNLRELRVLDIQRTDLTESALRHFRSHRQLRRIIHSTPVGDTGIEALVSIPHLRVESLRCKDVSDEGLRQAAHLKSLVRIDIDSRRVTDAGLASLNRLEHLVSVNLANCEATDEGIRQLAMAPALGDLQIDGIPLNGQCLAALAKRPKLKRIEFRDTGVGFGRIAEHFGSTATTLHVTSDWVYQSGPALCLRLTGPTRSDDVQHLEQYRNVETVRLDRPPFDMAQAGSLERLPRLRSLAVNVTCDDTAAALLGRLTGLRQLTLGGRQAISADGYRHLARIKGLQVLRMRSCGLTDADLAFVPALQELETLEIPGNPISVVGLQHVQELPRLRRLNISFCPKVDDEAFLSISKVERLEDLSAQDTQVSDAGLVHLFDMPHLRDVTVLGSSVTPRGLRALRGALQIKGGSIY